MSDVDGVVQYCNSIWVSRIAALTLAQQFFPKRWRPKHRRDMMSSYTAVDCKLHSTHARKRGESGWNMQLRHLFATETRKTPNYNFDFRRFSRNPPNIIPANISSYTVIIVYIICTRQEYIPYGTVRYNIYGST